VGHGSGHRFKTESTNPVPTSSDRTVSHPILTVVALKKAFTPASYWFGCGSTPSYMLCSIYEGRLKSSWTHLITPSGNFVEVW
jgi:hypothetical protein